MRCTYTYRLGHTDFACPDKRRKRPHSIQLWVSNATRMKFKKKGRLSFNCLPKYACKVIKPKNLKSKFGNKDISNIVQDQKEYSTKT